MTAETDEKVSKHRSRVYKKIFKKGTCPLNTALEDKYGAVILETPKNEENWVAVWRCQYELCSCKRVKNSVIVTVSRALVYRAERTDFMKVIVLQLFRLCQKDDYFGQPLCFAVRLQVKS